MQPPMIWDKHRLTNEGWEYKYCGDCNNYGKAIMHYRVIRKDTGSFYYKEEMEFGDNLAFCTWHRA